MNLVDVLHIGLLIAGIFALLCCCFAFLALGLAAYRISEYFNIDTDADEDGPDDGDEWKFQDGRRVHR